MLRRIRHSRDGATAIEYALILACIALVMLVGLTALGGKTGSHYDYINDEAGKAMK